MKKTNFYLMLIFIMSLFSCIDTENKEEPEEEVITEPVTDSIFEKESIEIEGGEVDSLYNYGYPLQAVKLNDSTHVYQGDILIDTRNEIKIYEDGEEPPRTFQGVARTTGLWENGEIAYQFAPTITQRTKEQVLLAIKWLTENTNLTFKETPSMKGYVYFQNGGGCSSYIGKTGYKQPINLSRDGCGVGSTIHEIMHAAGFWHEQSRIDRDKYVKVLWENILAGTEHNFQLVSNYRSFPSSNFTTELDFNSIMLYPSSAFSKNGQPTLVKLDGSRYTTNRVKPSEGDIESFNKLYPGSTPTEPIKPTYENGKFYTIEGLTVMFYENEWFYNGPYKWRKVELRELHGRKIWYYAKNSGDVPDFIRNQ